MRVSVLYGVYTHWAAVGGRATGAAGQPEGAKQHTQCTHQLWFFEKKNRPPTTVELLRHRY